MKVPTVKVAATNAPKSVTTKKKTLAKEKWLGRAKKEAPASKNDYTVVDYGKPPERMLRLLPDIQGIHSLTKIDSKRDVRDIQTSFERLEAKFKVEEPIEEPKENLPSLPKKKRRLRPSSISPEELVSTIPVCRKAVKVTKQELNALFQERQELENLYQNLRWKYIQQARQLQAEEKNNDKVLAFMRTRVEAAAKKLKKRRRRNTAMQDILNELQEREETIASLREDNERLRHVVNSHGLIVPEDNRFHKRDIVETPYGRGVVEAIRFSDDVTTVKFVWGKAYLQKSKLKVVDRQSLYSLDDEALKAEFLRIAGNWAAAEEKVAKLDEQMEHHSEEDGGNNEMMKKKRRLIHFTGTKLDLAPPETPLLLSPLSELPSKIVAVGDSLHLPPCMQEWEENKFENVRLQGELERLKFQLQQAEGAKKEAQRQLIEQTDSMNDIIEECKRLRGHEVPQKGSKSSRKMEDDSHDKEFLETPVPSPQESPTHRNRTASMTSDFKFDVMSNDLLMSKRRSLRPRNKSPADVHTCVLEDDAVNRDDEREATPLASPTHEHRNAQRKVDRAVKTRRVSMSTTTSSTGVDNNANANANAAMVNYEEIVEEERDSHALVGTPAEEGLRLTRHLKRQQVPLKPDTFMNQSMSSSSMNSSSMNSSSSSSSISSSSALSKSKNTVLMTDGLDASSSSRRSSRRR